VSESPLDVDEVVTVSVPGEEDVEFHVVGLMEDDESGETYAVLVHDEENGEERFIVTDAFGALLQDDVLAQSVLDDFLAGAEDEEER
jgi:hypothetical protein